MMTRKHFEAMAAIIRDSRAEPINKATEYTAKRMADFFATENPNFDRERFLTACGIS